MFVSDLLRKRAEASEGPTFHLNSKLKKLYAEELQKSGLLENSERSGFHLTDRGSREITVVMAGGSFDIIHPGHIETLEKAKALGDVLIVSIARDSTYLHNKEKNPIHDEKMRRKMVDSIKFVDAAILGSEVDIFATVGACEPRYHRAGLRPIP